MTIYRPAANEVYNNEYISRALPFFRFAKKDRARAWNYSWKSGIVCTLTQEMRKKRSDDNMNAGTCIQEIHGGKEGAENHDRAAARAATPYIRFSMYVCMYIYIYILMHLSCLVLLLWRSAEL
jgi:hypothetical protein